MADILVVTKEIDPHSDVVISKLDSTVYRLDIEDLVLGLVELLITEDSVCIISRGHKLSLFDIKVVYWRKPLLEPCEIPSYSEELYNQWAYTLENLAAVLSHAQWINHPAVFWRSSKKLFQIILAKNLGFRIPKSVFSNIPSSSFSKVGENSLIFKSIVTQHILQGVSLEKSFGNVLLDVNDLENKDVVPSLFQSYISKVAEWRVTVVGELIFPGRITTDSQYVDIKEVKNTNVKYQPLPEGIGPRLINFMKYCDLDFCAFDFLEDKKGQLWFLEANPNGQWLWVEASTNQDISGSIANLIQSKLSNKSEVVFKFEPLHFSSL